MTEKDNFINLCNLTTTVLGLRKGSLAYKSRKQDLQVARTVASIIARTEENIHRTIIADVIKRDRSLIYHYEKMHKGNYASWEKYRNAFNKVYKSYKDISDSKKVFYDTNELQLHLLQSGLIECGKNQVTIRITSGGCVLDLNTSYFNFSNQIEICKIALQDYDYSVQII